MSIITAARSAAKSLCSHASNIIDRTPRIVFALAGLALVAPLLPGCATSPMINDNKFQVFCETSHNEIGIQGFPSGSQYFVTFDPGASTATISAAVNYVGGSARFTTSWWENNPNLSDWGSFMGVNFPNNVQSYGDAYAPTPSPSNLASVVPLPLSKAKYERSYGVSLGKVPYCPSSGGYYSSGPIFMPMR